MSEAILKSADLHIDSKEAEPKQAWDEKTSPEKKDEKSKINIILGKIGDIVWGTEEAFADIKEEDKPFKTKFDIILDYSGYATIQGLNYIFFDYQSIFGKLFWVVTIIMMLVLGMYSTALSYAGWQDAPVLTTITTTDLPVEEVAFPAVTFCSPGSNKNILTAAIINEFFNYSKFLSDSPYNIARVINKVAFQYTTVPSDLLDSEAYKLYKDFPDIFLRNLSNSFLTKKLPEFYGTDLESLETIITLLSTSNPDAVLSSMWNFMANFQIRPEDFLNNCDPGYVPDTISKHCYKVITPSTSIRLDFNGSQEQCNMYDSLFQLDDFLQMGGLLAIMFQGKVPLTNQKFFMNAIRSGSSFIFIDTGQSVSSYPSLVLPPDDDPSLDCLVATANLYQAQFVLQPTSCEAKIATAAFCMYRYVDPIAMSKPGFMYDYLLNPIYKKNLERNFATQMNKYLGLISLFTQNIDFESFYSVLWHTNLPCFDVKGMTGSADGDSSILKYCEWKGVPHHCSLMFDTFPTDRGMCCSFNMRKAEEIFNGETYPQTIQTLQERDRVNSFNSALTALAEGEPSTVAGRSKGLVVMLDSHSNILAPGTVDTDFNGFFGLISPPGEFPFIAYGGFPIRPGSINEISLTSTVVSADDSLRTLDPISRGCKFAEENNLIIHKNYSMTNCLFECALFYAYDQMGLNCTPWFLPSVEKSIKMCDPWQSAEFLEIMSGDIPDDKCSMCLPDCNVNMYQKTITTIPFRECDSGNLGVSFLCNLNDIGITPRPQLFSDIVLESYINKSLDYLVNLIQSKTRTPLLSSSISIGILGSKESVIGYNAYEKDIATVKIFFDTPTVLEIGTQATMTWIDFFANVGGLLGLVLGMGIISFVELVWLALRLIAHSMNLTYWIP